MTEMSKPSPKIANQPMTMISMLKIVTLCRSISSARSMTGPPVPRAPMDAIVSSPGQSSCENSASRREDAPSFGGRLGCKRPIRLIQGHRLQCPHAPESDRIIAEIAHQRSAEQKTSWIRGKKRVAKLFPRYYFENVI